jgi:hypothetical protein
MRTVKIGNMKIKMTTLTYGQNDATRGTLIETDFVSVVIRTDGSVHVMQANETRAYNNEKKPVIIYSSK